MLSRRHFLAGSAMVLAITEPSRADDVPVRIATLNTGTVAWEVDTIIHNGFDKKHGIALTLAVRPELVILDEPFASWTRQRRLT